MAGKLRPTNPTKRQVGKKTRCDLIRQYEEIIWLFRNYRFAIRDVFSALETSKWTSGHK